MDGSKRLAEKIAERIRGFKGVLEHSLSGDDEFEEFAWLGEGVVRQIVSSALFSTMRGVGVQTLEDSARAASSDRVLERLCEVARLRDVAVEPARRKKGPRLVCAIVGELSVRKGEASPVLISETLSSIASCLIVLSREEMERREEPPDDDGEEIPEEDEEDEEDDEDEDDDDDGDDEREEGEPRSPMEEDFGCLDASELEHPDQTPVDEDDPRLVLPAFGETESDYEDESEDEGPPKTKKKKTEQKQEAEQRDEQFPPAITVPEEEGIRIEQGQQIAPPSLPPPPFIAFPPTSAEPAQIDVEKLTLVNIVELLREMGGLSETFLGAISKLVAKWDRSKKRWWDPREAHEKWKDKVDLCTRTIQQLFVRLHELGKELAGAPKSDLDRVKGNLQPTVFDLCAHIWFRQIALSSDLPMEDGEQDIEQPSGKVPSEPQEPKARKQRIDVGSRDIGEELGSDDTEEEEEDEEEEEEEEGGNEEERKDEDDEEEKKEEDDKGEESEEEEKSEDERKEEDEGEKSEEEDRKKDDGEDSAEEDDAKEEEEPEQEKQRKEVTVDISTDDSSKSTVVISSDSDDYDVAILQVARSTGPKKLKLLSKSQKSPSHPVDPLRFLEESTVHTHAVTAAAAASEPEPPPFVVSSSEESSAKVTISPRFTRLLKDYQLSALAFIWKRVIEGNSGAILADEMGMGKTATALAFLDTYLRSGRGSRALVLLPNAVIPTWELEIEKWLPSPRPFDVAFITDATKPANAQKRIISESGKPLLVASSFMRFARLEFLAEWADLVVVDEAHLLKNKLSKRGESARRILTKKRLCLTGYPLQNSVAEFFSVAMFALPDEKIANDRFIQRLDSIMASPDSVTSQRLLGGYFNKLLKPFILRRRAAETLPNLLPCKHEITLFVKLSPLQRQLYRVLYEWLVREKQRCFAMETTLMQLLNHPATVHSFESKEEAPPKEAPQTTAKTAEVATQPQRGQSPSPQLPPEFREASKDPEWENVENSTKMVLLMRIVARVLEKGEKVLVFSKYLQTIDFIKKHLPNGAKQMVITGSVCVDRRRELVSKFQREDAPFNVFLLSVKAAGHGINLHSANHVVLVDRDWNPVHEIQAAMRVYRLGQTKETFVYRLVASGTGDAAMYGKQLTKESLARIVVDSNARQPRNASQDSTGTWLLRDEPPDLPEQQEADNEFLGGLLRDCSDLLVGHAFHERLLNMSPDVIDLTPDELQQAKTLFDAMSGGAHPADD